MTVTTLASETHMLRALQARHKAHYAGFPPGMPVLRAMVDAGCSLPCISSWMTSSDCTLHALMCAQCNEFGALSDANYYGVDAVDMAFSACLNAQLESAMGYITVDTRPAYAYLERARLHYGPGGAGEILTFRRKSDREAALLVGIVRTLGALDVSHPAAYLATRALLRALLRERVLRPRALPAPDGTLLYLDSANCNADSDSDLD